MFSQLVSKVAKCCLLSTSISLLFSMWVYAESNASYPKGWEDWPVVKESMNLPADTVLPPDTSLFIQESVRAYSWINNGEGSPLTIRVNPKKIEQYKTHGPYTDGPLWLPSLRYKALSGSRSILQAKQFMVATIEKARTSLLCTRH